MKLSLRLSTVALALAGTLMAAPAQAEHHARLSADLADHLSAGSQLIDVIVHGDAASVSALARRYNLSVKKSLKEGAVLRVNAGQLDALRRDETQDHLSGDIRIRSIADVTTEAIGADQVWTGSDDVPSLTGDGVAVAVIDSGIDTRHNAFLRNRVIATRDFTGGDGIDRFGHGTHVAGIIAGQRGRTAETRDYRGVAPGASLINLRVLGDDGSGVASDVIDAIDWATDHKHEYKIRVINLSLGAPVMQPYRDDPLCEAVERATKAGITVVVAAGNFGRTTDGKSVYGAITTPGNSPHALTVGAIDTHGTPQRSDDTLAPYSSKGPTRYDLILKPDVSAPGSHVVSAEAAGSYLSTTYRDKHVAGVAANAYMQLSGTSMAAGVVSGAVALLIEERPSLKPADAKAALQLTSTFLPAAGLAGAGAGEVNLLGAAQLLTDSRRETLGSVEIAGEIVETSGIVTTVNADKVASTATNRLVAYTRRANWTSSEVNALTIVWGSNEPIAVRSNTIIWGSTIVWGSTIIWGSSEGEGTIIWGNVDANTIIWGNSEGESTIIWGSNEGETIIWGSNADGESTIIWGSTAGGAATIIWRSTND